MADAAPPVFTVHQAMIVCGMNDGALFQGATQAS